MYFLEKRKANQLCKVFNVELPTKKNPIVQVFNKHRITYLTPKLRKEWGIDDEGHPMNHIRYGLHCGKTFKNFVFKSDSINPYNWIMWAILENMNIELGPGDKVHLGLGITIERWELGTQAILSRIQGDNIMKASWYRLETDGGISANDVLTHYVTQVTWKKDKDPNEVFKYVAKGGN